MALRPWYGTRGLPVFLAVAVIAIAWVFAEQQNRKVFEQSVRAEVLGKVSVIRAKLEGNVNGNIQLVRGLIATLETEPDMDQLRFARLVSNLLAQDSQIRNIAGAPDLVVKLMYPIRGNEQAIGVDYSTLDAQREAAFRARDTGELVLAGPVELVQGGQAFIARFPVFTPTNDGRRLPFWGIVSAVVDVDRLYGDSGMLDENLPIDIALIGQDALGSVGQLFYGDAATVENDPVTSEVIMPSGSWQIAATPKGGWPATPDNIWELRLFMAFAAALILVPTILTARLIKERQNNIRELKRREIQLAGVSRRLGLALDTSKLAVWEMNIGGTEQFWDNRMNALYGYPADGKPRYAEDWERRVHPDDLPQAKAEFDAAVKSRGSYVSQFRIVLDNGEVRHVRAFGGVHADDGFPRLIGVNWDVTADVSLNEELKRVNALTEARNAELESAKARIEHNALHDSLTGLPNRRYLDELLAEHARAFADGDATAGLLQIDLDRFKQINDTLGHIAGDAMLMHAADVLRSAARKGDFVARIGGDEFVLVRRWTRGEKGDACTRALAKLAEDIIERMKQPVIYQQHECRVGVSIGIAADTDSVADPLRLLVNADIALYRAKERGRNRYQFFNDALQAEIITTKRVADDILSGIEQNRFVAHYQPQFDAATLEVIGVEALARWNHPTKGLLAPAAFMKIAEELNVVATIDRVILEQTLADVRRWEKTGIKIPKASVNVSARRLHDEELISNLRQMDIRPGTIAFELVESIFLDDNDELLTWNVDQIKELGIDVEIDDFGTGYASIVSLMKLKPRRLKIDRQLIMPIVRSPAQRQLVGSIIDIGRSLGIEVLAEGVETMEHARILRQLGCNALQGYAFARPMGAQELIDFVQSRRWRVAS